jgi:hypothetical protein
MSATISRHHRNLPQRACEHCGATYTPRHPAARFCPDERCSYERRKEREARAEHGVRRLATSKEPG